MFWLFAIWTHRITFLDVCLGWIDLFWVAIWTHRITFLDVCLGWIDLFWVVYFTTPLREEFTLLSFTSPRCCDRYPSFFATPAAREELHNRLHYREASSDDLCARSRLHGRLR